MSMNAAKPFTPGNFDPSILGRTREDIENMEADERAAARIEDINRAIDLLREITRAYDGLHGSPAITRAIASLLPETR
jgi:hypothetical protein